MKLNTIRASLFAAVALSAGLLAACGGGGGGGGGGGTPPTNPPTSPPTNPPTSPPTTPPGGSGMLSIPGGALGSAKVVYTCGCSAQAGTTMADSSGNYTLSPSATATPASPSPMYTMVPGRNYLVVGANPSTHQEAWTVFFLGNVASRNLYLGPTAGQNTTDAATAAVGLYIFLKSPNNSDTSFDDWNFNTLAAWAQKLRKNAGTAGNTPAENKLLNDITTFQTSGTAAALFPTQPAWDPDPSTNNNTIAGDVSSITPASDATVPTPCPVSGGTPACTGAPSP